jgi:hypothetical protein
VIEIVKKYNSIGLQCLPCSQDKLPAIPKEGTWKRNFDLKEFTSKAIGIKCGSCSDNLECLDLDNHDGKGQERLLSFIPQIKDLYDKYKFPIEQTQGGGYHILWKCDYIEGNQKLAEVPKMNDQGKWVGDAIFETRGEGGYFVAYPSPGYKVIKNDIFTIPRITKEERSIIISISKSYNIYLKNSDIKKSEYEGEDRPGDYYNKLPEAIDEAKDVLIGAGWKQSGQYNWIRPGKTKGVSATFGKAAENIFYPFSANAYPFDMEVGYTPFQIIGLLKYNGDFKQWAKDLAERLNLSHTKPEQKINKSELSKDQKFERLKKAFINTEIEIEKPPTILYISDLDTTFNYKKRLFTLGNFSAIIGKAKSRKTFLLAMLTAALIRNDNLYNKFYGALPIDKRFCLYFDTEQGLYDSANTIKRIERMAAIKLDNLIGFNIREYSPFERCEIIEDALNKWTNIGFVAIDGIADLATANNDEEEATRVTGLFLRWTKQYNCHISTIIHQNKNDNFATGWLGSAIMKKSEIVISTSKDKGSIAQSKVSCDYSRSIDFLDFFFRITDDGLPEPTSENSEANVTEVFQD